jgi:hypothetical protein
MTTTTKNGTNEQTARRYFALIGELRAGKAESLDRLMELWEPEGIFEFNGPAPLNGAFHGATAIRTLYANRLKASGMPLRLETSRAQPDDVSLGLVETHVETVRSAEAKVLAGWKTTVAAGQHGFDVPGSHEFVFGDDGKIKRLRVSVSHKPVPSRLNHLSMEGLHVRDLGKLSTAAWMVV